MKALLTRAALAGLCWVAAGAAFAGTAKVNFVHPENYADLPFTPWDRDEILHAFTEHFDKLAKALPEDQQLQIDVLDVDLAGRMVPNMTAGRDLRVLKGRADWPRIDLRYSVVAGDKVITSGEAKLSDMAYMDRVSHYSDGDMLRYEKQMLDTWFYKVIAPRKPRR